MRRARVRVVMSGLVMRSVVVMGGFIVMSGFIMMGGFVVMSGFIMMFSVVVMSGFIVMISVVVFTAVMVVAVVVAAARELHHCVERVVERREPLLDPRTAGAALGAQRIGVGHEIRRRVIPRGRLDVLGRGHAVDCGRSLSKRLGVLAGGRRADGTGLGVEHRRDLVVKRVDLGDVRAPVMLATTAGSLTSRAARARSSTASAGEEPEGEEQGDEKRGRAEVRHASLLRRSRAPRNTDRARRGRSLGFR